MTQTVELLAPSGAVITVDATVEGDALWLSPGDLTSTTGFELKPEGFCRDELCYPVPSGREADSSATGA